MVNKVNEQVEYIIPIDNIGNLPLKTLEVYPNYWISPNLLVAIIEAIIEQFIIGNIASTMFKDVISDLVFLYGATLFDDISKHSYAEEIIEIVEKDNIKYLDLCMTDCTLYPSDSCHRPVHGSVLYVDSKSTINLDLLIVILEVVTEQFDFDVIDSHDYKHIIVDLCGFYGSIIFDDLETKHFSKVLVDKIDNEILCYIEICLDNLILVYYDTLLKEEIMNDK